jgi:hypothetical protein
MAMYYPPPVYHFQNVVPYNPLAITYGAPAAHAAPANHAQPKDEGTDGGHRIDHMELLMYVVASNSVSVTLTT